MKKALLFSAFLFSFYISTAQWTNGNDIYNTNSGNVGIGTQTPLTKLHVQGQFLLDGDMLVGPQKDNPGYGRKLYFDNGGNLDALWISRFNAFNDATELRVNIGDDGGANDNL